MKKFMSIAIALILILSLAGCSPGKSDEELKAELKEEVKAELKAEMEAEMKAERETEGESEIESAPENESEAENEEKVEIVDMNVEDMDMVFEKFISQNYPEFTREDFDIWNKLFLDVNGDGKNEVVFSSDYYDGHLEKAIVLGSDNGQYKELSKSISLAKYSNEYEMKDGFLIHKTKYGGSGIFDLYMDVYRWDGDQLSPLGLGILTESYVGTPNECYEIKSEIEGNLDDFAIIYNKTDLNEDDAKPELIAKDHYYIDDAVGSEYVKIPISIGNSGQDFSEVFDGKNLNQALEYFYKNVYFLSEERQKDFAGAILKVIKEDINNFKAQGDFLPLSEDGFDKDTLEYDTSKVDENSKKVLEKIRDRYVYMLVKPFYATEGSVEEYDGFDILFYQWSKQIIDMAISLNGSAEEAHLFNSPEAYFNSDYTEIEEFVSDCTCSNILVENYNSIKSFEGQDTWKLNLFLPVNIVIE